MAMNAEDDNATRRDFLVVAANAFFLVGGAATLWPFVAQMNPDADALALSSIEVDLAPIQPGQAVTVLWRGKPVFVRNRMPQEIEQARAVNLAELRDDSADNPALPPDASAADDNRVKAGHENWLVLIGVCTHLGCIPKGQTLGDARGEFGGWFCPCHGSHYDTAGRIRKGPAPRNLGVPPYEFVSDAKIKIG